MDWLDIVKLTLPAAVCAYVLGPRVAIAFLVVMVVVAVFGVGLLEATMGDKLDLAAAFAKVGKQGPTTFGQMMGPGAAGVIVGWWLRYWVAMVRSSRMTQGS